MDGIAKGLAGQMYQIVMSILLLIRSKVKNYPVFSLRTEVHDAGAIDDIQFKNDTKIQFIQLKAKEKEGKLIPGPHIFQSDSIKGDYNLLKYIISCKIIEEQPHFLDESATFERAVLFTNADLKINAKNTKLFMDLSNLQGIAGDIFKGIQFLEVTKIDLDDDDILKFKNNLKVKYYKFTDPRLPQLLKEMSEKFEEKLCKIKDRNVCEEWLVKNFQLLSKQEIEKCLDKIIYACNQPNDNGLLKLITEEMSEYCKTKCDSLIDKLKNKILEWMTTKGGDFPNTIDKDTIDNFFQKNSKVVEFNVTSPISTFTGRDIELQNIYEILHGIGNVFIVADQKIIGLIGLGGIGKTQLAKAYAQKYKADYFGRVIWINSEVNSLIEEDFRELARKINLPDIDKLNTKELLDRILNYFKGYKTLFIFDNAQTHPEDEANDHVVNFRKLVSAQNLSEIHILITSRDRKYIGKAATFDLSILNIADAEKLIKGQLPDTTDSESKQLSELLQYFPLTLQQAISYVKQEKEKYQIIEQNFTVSNYIEIFKKNSEKLLGHKCETDEGRTLTQTTEITWNTTLEIIKKDEHFGDAAIKALNVLAYLNVDLIETKLVFEILEEQYKIERDSIIMGCKLLEKYSMITIEEAVVGIHRMVQETVKNRLNKDKIEESILNCLLSYFTTRYSDTEDHFSRINSVIRQHLSYFIKHVLNYKFLIDKYSKYDFVFDENVVCELCKLEDLDTLKHLLEKRELDVNKKCLYKTSIFYEIVKLRNENLIKLCIEKGARFNRMLSSKTYLHKAVQGNDLETTKFFLEKKWFKESKKYAEEQFLQSLSACVNTCKRVLNDAGSNHLKDMYPLCGYWKNTEHEIVELLVDENINVDALDSKGCSALYYACIVGNLEIVKILCKQGANVNLIIETKNSSANVLYFAANNGHVEIVEFLLKNGADPIIADKDFIFEQNYEHELESRTAIENNNINAVRDLIENNTKMVENEHGNTILHLAFLKSDLNVIKLLEKRYLMKDVNYTNSDGRTFLHLLSLSPLVQFAECIIGSIKKCAFKRLLYLSECLIELDMSRESPISVSRILNYLLEPDNQPILDIEDPLIFFYQYFRKLIQRFCKISKTTIPYELLYLRNLKLEKVHNYMFDKLKYLIEAGINVNIQDNQGNTALHYAVMYCSSNIVTLLVDCGASPNIANKDGNTPLHFAIQYNLEQKTNILLNKDDLTILSLGKNGRPFLLVLNLIETYLFNSGNASDLEILQFYASYIKNEFSYMNNKRKIDAQIQYIGIEENYVGLLKTLFQPTAICDINNFDGKGKSILHFAVLSGYSAVVQWVLKNFKVDLNRKDSQGNTALNLCAKKLKYAPEDDEVMKCLLCYDLDVNLADNINRAPLHFAVKYNNTELVKKLIEKKADPTLQDNNGDTPLHYLDFLKLRFFPLGMNFINYRCNLNRIADILIEKNNKTKKIKNKEGLTFMHKIIKEYQRFLSYSTYRLELFEHFGDIKTIDNYGNSLLHTAVETAYYESDLKLLIKKETAVNVKNLKQQTPLHIALLKHRPFSIIKLLVENKANLTAKDYDGNTPLHLLFEKYNFYFNNRNYEYTLKILKMFLKYNKKCLLMKNNAGHTVKDLLYARKRFELILPIEETLHCLLPPEDWYSVDSDVSD